MKMAHRLYPEPGNAACLVDVGEVDTELVICKGKDIAFSRKIPVTGKDFTRSMTEALISDLGRTELSAGEAEDIKRKVGIPAEGELKTIDGKITTAQVLSMLRTPAEQLAAEISRSFDYIREEVSGVSVDKLVLFGGGASLGGLLKFISTELGMNAVLGDSLEGLALEPHAVIDRGKVSYSLELAVGAALAGSGGLNLLPAEVRKMAGRTFRRASYEAVAAAAIFISAFLYIGMRMKLDNFNTRIEFAKKELVGLDSQLKYSEAKALADKVLLDEPFWEEVLRELSNSVPSDIHLTELAMAKNTLTVKGVASSRDNDAVISDFITAMEKGLFDNVRIVSTKDVEGGDTTEFELAFWVDMG
jgi:cell division ATPase FtsA